MAGNALMERAMELGNRLAAQSDAQGALPQLYAATMPDVAGGSFYGPDGFMKQRGYPEVQDSSSRSHDEADAERLWKWSEEKTGVTFPW